MLVYFKTSNKLLNFKLASKLSALQLSLVNNLERPILIKNCSKYALYEIVL